jgi:alcohol dehydrogenase class IV
LKGGETFPANFRPKPIIAIPTTAGTGSEVTMWGTVWDFDEKKKFSISHPSLYAEKALLDSQLTASLPEKDTIYGALDALSHAMEAIWNTNHNPISDSFALKAIELVMEYLPQVKDDPGNRDFRDFLLQASLQAGLAFSNTKTALAHSISYPLTAFLGLPHGLACALPLPHILELNGNYDFDRIKIMAPPLKSPPTLESMQDKINHLFQEVGVSSRLKDHGADEAKLGALAASAYTPGRADNNLRPVEQEDLTTLVNKLF